MGRYTKHRNMETRNMRSFALLTVFFAIANAATTKKTPAAPVVAPAAAPAQNKATQKETFTVTINLYSGRPDNPTWIIEGDRKLPDNIIRRMLKLDNHGPDHAAHGGHAGHGSAKKKQLANVNGYSGITIDHKETDGFTHTMVIPKCDDPFLEWDIIAKTFLKGSGTYPVRPTTRKTIREALQKCVIEERKKKATAAAAAAAKGDAKVATKQAHDHAGHAH